MRNKQKIQFMRFCVLTKKKETALLAAVSYDLFLLINAIRLLQGQNFQLGFSKELKSLLRCIFHLLVRLLHLDQSRQSGQSDPDESQERHFSFTCVAVSIREDGNNLFCSCFHFSLWRQSEERMFLETDSGSVFLEVP